MGKPDQQFADTEEQAVPTAEAGASEAQENNRREQEDRFGDIVDLREIDAKGELVGYSVYPGQYWIWKDGEVYRADFEGWFEKDWTFHGKSDVKIEADLDRVVAL